MTLLEVMVVVVIAVIISVMLVGGSGQLAGARLKHAATALTGAVRVAFTRATATSKNLRLVFDLDASTMWLEEGDAPMLVTRDKGSGGADPATEAERAAVAEGESILKGPKVARAHFHAIKGISLTADQISAQSGAQPVAADDDSPAKPAVAPAPSPIALPRGITFRQVQSMHDDEPRTSGRAYLYFWPGGLTERSSIQLRIGKSEDDGDTLSLLVSPLTGKVTIKNGPTDLVIPTNDKEASERDDNGAF